MGRMIGWYGEGDPVGFIIADIGVIMVLAAYPFARGRSART